MSEWISVENGLPEEEKDVLIFNNNSFYIGCICFSDPIYWTDPEIGELKEVTHWMPLPELPKVSDN